MVKGISRVGSEVRKTTGRQGALQGGSLSYWSRLAPITPFLFYLLFKTPSDTEYYPMKTFLSEKNGSSFDLLPSKTMQRWAKVVLPL